MEVAERFIPFLASQGLPDSAGGFEVSQLVLLAAGALGLTIVLRSTYRRLNRSINQSQPSAQDRFADMEAETRARHDVQQVLLELDEVARQIQGRIDTRFAKLESIIRDADERIDRLSRLVRTADGGQAVDVTVGDGQPAEAATPDSRISRISNAAIYRLADGGATAVRIAEQVGRTTGEIELILALRKAERGPGKPAQPAGAGRTRSNS